MPKASHKNKILDYRRARNLRHDASPSEQKLWRALQQLSKQAGIRFRRQHPLHPYIADFACLKAKLIIELDGASHENRHEYDKRRDMRMEWQRFEVLRFSNRDVAINLDGVTATILVKARELLKANNPSPSLAKARYARQAKLSSPAKGEE